MAKLKGRDREILMWLNEGRSTTWIARECDVSTQAIRDWKQRNVETWHRMRNAQRRAKRLNRAMATIKEKVE
jgi:hypothetical protein